ncbi:MAG: hypothetical protein KF812_00075 [Fimbriimonadaceae bacterium]|nr:hypothetical protein [Fimbriimonadaceae bacterium]
MRVVGGVIVGFIATALVIFALASVSWLILGPSGSFEPGTWKTTTTWGIGKLIVDTIAAFVGGLIAYRIGGKTSAHVLAGIILVLGLVMAFVVIGNPPPGSSEPRPEVVSMTDAMNKALESPWALYASPVLSCLAVLFAVSRSEKKVTAS